MKSKSEHWLRDLIEESTQVDSTGDHRTFPHSSLDAVVDKDIENVLKNVKSPTPAGDEEAESPQDQSDESFDLIADEIARIVTHSSDIIDIHGIVLRRALNAVAKKGGQHAAQAVMSILEKEYDISVDSRKDLDRIPNAAGAGPEV